MSGLIPLSTVLCVIEISRIKKLAGFFCCLVGGFLFVFLIKKYFLNGTL